jgi:hypothetical protein
MRLSESYVNHFVKNDGIELNDELDKLFNNADIQLIDGKFEFIIDASHQCTYDDHIMGHVLTVLLQTAFVDKLEKLVIRAKPITDVTLIKLCGHLESMEQLTYLDLSLCDITDSGLVKLAETLPYTNITTLLLSGNKLSINAAKALGESLGKCERLEIVELADCGLTYDGFVAIFNSIRSPKSRLMKLDISGTRLLGCEQKLAYHIEDTLKQNPRLRRLHIRKSGLTDEAVARIANGLNYADHLTLLDLSANKLSRDSAGLLCPVLHKLDVLDLSDNRIQSEGAANFAATIKNDKIKLHTLLLRNCSIEDDGIQHILDAVAHPNSSIRRIHLWGNNFSDGGSAKLDELMKNRVLIEPNTDCRASSQYHPGEYRPAELHRPNLQQPGVL